MKSLIKYVPVVPEEPQLESTAVTQWSLGIAMFAAFVIPFLLLFTSARYRAVLHNTQQKLGFVSWRALDNNDSKLPLEKIPTPQPGE